MAQSWRRALHLAQLSAAPASCPHPQNHHDAVCCLSKVGPLHQEGGPLQPHCPDTGTTHGTSCELLQALYSPQMKIAGFRTFLLCTCSLIKQDTLIWDLW